MGGGVLQGDPGEIPDHQIPDISYGSVQMILLGRIRYAPHALRERGDMSPMIGPVPPRTVTWVAGLAGPYG